MKLLKLTAFASIIFISVLTLSSCENDDELAKTNVFAKTDIPLTGAQVVPASTSSGTGTLDVSYDRRTKTLTYRVDWAGLTDSVMAVRISALAPVSYSALNSSFTAWTATAGFRPFADTTTPYTWVQQFTNGLQTVPVLGSVGRGLYGPSGSYNGTLIVDGVKVKEVDLLNGMYYLTLHTETFIGSPANVPASCQYRWYGEVRAQIKFQ